MDTAQLTKFAVYLQPTRFMDYEHEAVREFTAENAKGGSDFERAIALYYAVRDGLRYDVYDIDLSVEGLRASGALALGRGWCVSKAALLAACYRAIGIPARLGYADVRNHLSTERLRRFMGTDLFIWHGYTDVYLNGRWVKATPAFNIELCEKFRIHPLDFDGLEDSVYHPCDLDGREHMEYLRFRGDYADLPLTEMQRDFAATYPRYDRGVEGADFDADVERETSKENPHADL